MGFANSRISYAVQRVAQGVVVILGIVVANFLLVHLVFLAIYRML